MHRSLSIFNSRILIPIVAISLLLTVPSYFYREVVSANSFWMIKEHDYKSFGHKAKILILGNSHLMHLFEEVDKPQVFNHSVPSLNYLQTYYLLKYLIEKTDHSFDTIVLPLSLESFARSAHASKGYLFFWSRYFDYVDLTISDSRGSEFHWYEYIEGAFFPYIGHWHKIKQFFCGKDVHLKELADEKRVRVFSQMPQSKQQELLNRRFKTLFAKNQIIVPETIEYLERIIALCDQQKIKIIFVRAPVTTRLLAKVSHELNIEAYNKLARSVLLKHPQIQYFDYQYLAKGHDSWFEDVDHLNAYGAAQITRILIQDLKI